MHVALYDVLLSTAAQSGMDTVREVVMVMIL